MIQTLLEVLSASEVLSTVAESMNCRCKIDYDRQRAGQGHNLWTSIQKLMLQK
ncbi:hypothetical protein PSCFBP3800_00331 [Pseudomonas syringae group genomosp. 3]|uniref:Uncharacterized protein n=1 Tax=Pseudomonas syringae group genomosp. 3 TaxID=251701 RepID=A0A2K4W726_9PSED|nr:hypothetical protein CFBP6411_00324 [Pseudomonas syringae group genomosp. 3]SPF10403.1 hypothetical protein PSCFBP3800_00331 [Pseudomonas syringae group genomosp. 3]